MEKEYLIKKWLNDSLNEEELKAFRQLDDFENMNAIIENAKYFKASSFENPYDYDSFRKQRDELDRTRQSGSVWWKPLLRMTGIFIIGIALYFAFFQKNVSSVQTIAGEKTEFALPDDSKVTLNALTKIAFSEKEWESNRSVELQGEAFFKVSKGSKFKVVTPAGTVQVLGTQFNVKQRGDLFEVFCYEGIVRVVIDSLEEKLTAGDKLQWLSGSLSLGKHSYKGPHWLSNASRFENVPVLEVFAEMERQYGIEIYTEGVPETLRFTGGFRHDHLQNALIAVTVPLELRFNINNSKSVTVSPGE